MTYIFAIEIALILFVLFVSLSFTIPKLERFQWFKEHKDETFIIIFAPAAASIGVLIGYIIVLLIRGK